MSAFFNGWRRKAGCVTLVMALAAMGLWIKSLHICDTVEIAPGGVCYRIVSREGQLDYARCRDSDGGGFAISNMGSILGQVRWDSGPELSAPWELVADNPGRVFIPREAVDLDSVGLQAVENGAWHGFRFQKSQLGQFSLVQVTIPHWAIVIPLLLLSAYLILFRPRRRNTWQTVGPSGLN